MSTIQSVVHAALQLSSSALTVESYTHTMPLCVMYQTYQRCSVHNTVMPMQVDMTQLAQCHTGGDITSHTATDSLCSSDHYVHAGLVTFSQAGVSHTCDCVTCLT